MLAPASTVRCAGRQRYRERLLVEQRLILMQKDEVGSVAADFGSRRWGAWKHARPRALECHSGRRR